jgi:transcriptional regulator with XRE-family HTH domain
MSGQRMIAISGYFSNEFAPTITRNRLAIAGTLSCMKATSTKQILAANLRRLMDETPSLDTQMKVAARADIAQSTVGRMLRAEVNPQLHQIEAIADAFHVSVAELLTDTSAEEKSDPSIDLVLFKSLPESDKKEIAALIEFKTYRHQLEAEGFSTSGRKDLESDLKERVMQAIQRELNNDTLNTEHERKDETKPTRRRSSSR